MSDSGVDVQARLDRWRAQGAGRLDRVHCERIEALARRASTQHGAIRRLLDARLAELLDAVTHDAVPVTTERMEADATPAAVRERTGLAALIGTLDRTDTRDMPAGEWPMSSPMSPPQAFDRLEDVRRLCGHARADSQLRQALEHAPENAGPLNSANLVHRALTLMRDASPEYLDVFMAYVDALAWVEAVPMHAAGSAAAAAPAAKRARGKPRRRGG